MTDPDGHDGLINSESSRNTGKHAVVTKYFRNN